jgi:hypothetical protein
MTDKIETGGTAFPCLDSHCMGYEGMTLRDYFAAKAMQGMLSCGQQHDANTPSALSKDAYKIADAMLKAGTAK